MDAPSQEAPTIYPRETKISNSEPKRVPKTYDSEANFKWTNNKFPAHSALLKWKRLKVWTSAVGKKKYFRQ